MFKSYNKNYYYYNACTNCDKSVVYMEKQMYQDDMDNQVSK